VEVWGGNVAWPPKRAEKCSKAGRSWSVKDSILPIDILNDQLQKSVAANRAE
jgi:hypothetical protein